MLNPILGPICPSQRSGGCGGQRKYVDTEQRIPTKCQQQDVARSYSCKQGAPSPLPGFHAYSFCFSARTQHKPGQPADNIDHPLFLFFD